MAEKQQQFAIANLGRLNPLKLGKEGYLLRVEEAVGKTMLQTGQAPDSTQKRRVALVLAQDMLRSTADNTMNDAVSGERDAPKKFRVAAWMLVVAGGSLLLSFGVEHYAKSTVPWRDMVRVGRIGAIIAGVYSAKDALEGAFLSVAARIFRKRIPKLALMRDQLQKELGEMDMARMSGPHWKS